MRFSFKKSLSDIKKYAEYIANLHRRPQKRDTGKLCSQHKKNKATHLFFIPYYEICKLPPKFI